MRKLFVVVVGLVIIGLAGVLLAQQKFPNLPDSPVVLDNDKLVVQRMEFEPGEWAGSHSHSGDQLVVIVSEAEMVYKDEDGKETTRTFEAGEVMWIDAVTHDHKATAKGSAILITLK
jgi:quercetin dioxygenase-like cupin family protein